MKITSRNRFFTHALLAAAVTLLAAAPTAQAARAKKQAEPAPAVVAEPASPYTYELSFAYDNAANDLFDDFGKINTAGIDFTGVYAMDDHRAITLRLGIAYGSREEKFIYIDREHIEPDYTTSDKYELTRVTLMPGYRYTNPWGEKTKYFVGANVGLVYQGMEFKGSIDEESSSASANSLGLGYSAEIGLLYKYSERVTLLVAYQFSGSTNKTEFSDDDGEKYSIKQQMYHTIRAGVSFQF